MKRAQVTTTRALVQDRAWLTGARQLRSIDLDVGLHLNFSERLGCWGPAYPLRELMFRAYAKWLDRAAVGASIELQLDHFESALGRRPDYVDGHQHVHQLPVIREALLAALRRRYGSPPSVRCTVRRGAGSVWRSRGDRKAWVIEALGGRKFDWADASLDEPQTMLASRGTSGFSACTASMRRHPPTNAG